MNTVTGNFGSVTAPHWCSARADAIVGRATRGDGLLGYGVISARESLSPPSAADQRAHQADTRSRAPTGIYYGE